MFRACSFFNMESINDLGEQRIVQLSGTRYFVVFQAWTFFSPDLLTIS